ncbi:MAG TPA: hypothetical protein VF169_26825 [Albitalea sp.]|uniref:hypothetical protein n=1 Tax=Piscinibacter sp. TaxID=1903157 RepID=UPI002ED199D7
MHAVPTSRFIALPLGMALLAAATVSPAALGSRPAPAARTAHVDFGRSQPSTNARRLVDAVVATGDNAGANFIVLDKIAAKVFVFEPGGKLRGWAPALLGLAKGDDTVPGIGEKKISEIKPEERTTPAGRFVAEFGQSASRGEDVVWVDYDAAVSMHRVVTSNPKERRLERLATPSAKDNRISYGCINLPKAFYEKYVGPTVAHAATVVYVLPETRPLQHVFAFLDADARPRLARQGGSVKSLRAGPPEGVEMPLIDQ